MQYSAADQLDHGILLNNTHLSAFKGRNISYTLLLLQLCNIEKFCFINNAVYQSMNITSKHANDDTKLLYNSGDMCGNSFHT